MKGAMRRSPKEVKALLMELATSLKKEPMPSKKPGTCSGGGARVGGVLVVSGGIIAAAASCCAASEMAWRWGCHTGLMEMLAGWMEGGWNRMGRSKRVGSTRTRARGDGG